MRKKLIGSEFAVCLMCAAKLLDDKTEEIYKWLIMK